MLVKYGIIVGWGILISLTIVQLEAARIVTGLPIFASSILIYKELGWESLAERLVQDYWE